MTALSPPDASGHASPAGAIIVFDGICVLCNGWVDFLLKHDRRARYRFAAMQGDTGHALLATYGLDPDDPVSFLLIEHDRGSAPRVSTDTVAIRRVLAGLGGVWRLATLSVLVPPFVRDPLYRVVARNRYRWFGRHEACRLPDPAQAHRFL